jgi:hypothetical protein
VPKNTKQIRKSITKKGKAKPRPRNRYMRRAQMSEYKFLKVLRAFADDVPAYKAETLAGASDTTIHNHYRRLRKRLVEAALSRRMDFGGAGHFLFDKDGYSKRGKLFIEEIISRGSFKEHLKRHRPRGAAQEEPVLAVEVAIRLFCHIHMSMDKNSLYSDGLREALKNFQNIGAFLMEYGEHPVVTKQLPELAERFEKAAEGLKGIITREELVSIREKSAEHRYANDVLYDDLRRYLLKHPL